MTVPLLAIKSMIATVNWLITCLKSQTIHVLEM